MNAPIVTVVQGTPGSCRATAAELGELGKNTHEVGTGLFRVRSESESCWTGTAGDNFREAMSKKGKAANDLGEATSRAKAALEKFADELQTVIAKMHQARTVATEHGLTVNATAIEPPGPPPPEPKLPPASLTPGKLTPQESKPLDDFEAAAAATQAHNRKVQGFHEAKATAEDARHTEHEAHKALESAMNYETGFLQYMLAGALWHVEGINRAMVTTPQGLADTFSKRASSLYERATKIDGTIDTPGITPAQQAARAAQRDELLHRSSRNQAASTKIQTSADRMYSRTGLNANIARGLGKTAKGIPLIGTGIAAGVQAEAVINDGKPAGKAGFNLGGGLLGGAVTGSITGTCVGGPIGTVVGVGVGVIGAGLGSWGGELFYDAVTEGD